MQFAKLRSGAKYSLATSGIAPMTLAELGKGATDELELTEHSPYGYPPLIDRIARYYDVDPECVVFAGGTSFANHLAFAALFEPGDEVLFEQPTYEPMLATARFLGAEVRRFQRRFDDGFRVAPREIERAMSPRTRLIVLCNFHNPTGVATDDATLRAVGEIARSHGAHVLVDEVYLELVFGNRPPTALKLGPEFVVTSSLTKAFGYGGLRCGWVLAEPDLARRMWDLNDLFSAKSPHVAEQLSVIAFDRLERATKRANAILAANRPLMDAFLSRSDVEVVMPAPQSTVAMPRLKHADPQRFFDLLRTKYETSVVPGEFFEMPGHFRIGIGGDAEMTREGFRRLALALDEVS